MKQRFEKTAKALAFCAGAFLLGGAAWAKDEPVLLNQSDKWLANFDVESCQLITSFGNGDDMVVMRLSRFALGDAFSLDIYGKMLKRDESRSKVKFRFGPDGIWRETWSANGAADNLPMMMLGNTDLLSRQAREETTLPAISPEQESAVRWLDIVTPGGKMLRLQTGSMVKPMKVMRECMIGLYKSWGFDPETLVANVRPAVPIGSPGNWLRTDDYPPNMLKKGGQGIVRFRLEIDEAGSVSRCHIQQRTNPDEFADLSCKLLAKRARFKPAVDSAGKPVRSFYMNAVRWILPE